MSRSDEFRYFQYFPPSRPLAAKGGIQAQSRRFGESWWARRWIAVLESFHLGSRLQRGRSYARRGQVLSIAVEKGAVEARVQGSRPAPYEVSIAVRQLSGTDWNKLVAALGEQAIFAAQLLNGEMPEEIEKIFSQTGLSLFPQRLSDLKTKCSCPDWSNPCKHIAAVYYLLGEEFDRDPFLIFRMRGMDRDELLALLGRAAPEAAEEPGAGEKPAMGELLPADPSRFWSAGLEETDAPWGEVRVPPVTAPLVRRMGAFPFWRGKARLIDVLEPVYRRGAERGLNLLAGMPPEQPAGIQYLDGARRTTRG